MKRYRQAGAYATAMFAFPRHDPDPIEFYETQLMLNYSRAVILEGDNPRATPTWRSLSHRLHSQVRRCTCGSYGMSRRRSGRGQTRGRSSYADAVVCPRGWRRSWVHHSATLSATI